MVISKKPMEVLDIYLFLVQNRLARIGLASGMMLTMP